MSKLFIISGPSGSGQDSVIENLSKLIPIERVITTSSRKIRPKETEGSPYYFISPKEFEKKIKNDEFFEHAFEYDNYYGVSKKELLRVLSGTKIGIWKIAYKGVISAKQKMPDVVAILINAPLEILEQRIRKRDCQKDEEYFKKRMEYTKEWLQHKDIYDYEVINEQDKLEQTVKQVLKIIQKY